MAKAWILSCVCCLAASLTVSTASTPWDPIVDVREVNVFNLLAEGTTLGDALRSSCTDNANADLYEPYGCPNLGAIEMDSVAIGNSSQQADLVATVVATAGLPAAVMAYFDVASTFNLTASQCTSGCQPLIHNVLKRDFDGVVSVSASAFAAVVAFQSIVEFSDVDNNGVFDPSVDSILSSYDFLSPSCEPLLWGPMNAYKKEGADGTTEYALNITTQDGVFSVEYAVSNADKDPSMARTKISVQITDYPYASEDMTSKLGLITYLGAARAGASLSAADGGKVTLNSGGFSGWFGWESTAMASQVSSFEASQVAVKYSSWQNIGPVAEEGLLNSIASVAFIDGGTDSALKVSYFSFDAPSPKRVYWDPELVFGGGGNNLGPGGDGAGLAVILVTVAAGVAVLAFGVAMAVLYRRSRKRQIEFRPLMRPAGPVVAAAGAAAGVEQRLGTGYGDGAHSEFDDAASDDTYITPLSRHGSVYISADQVAASTKAVRASAALVTCSTCKYTGVYGEGFCSNCGSLLDA